MKKISQASSAHSPEMSLPDNVEELLPLSPVQSGMLFHVIGRGDALGAHIGIVSVGIEGPVDAGRLQRSFDAAVQSRDVLRASFVYKDEETPVQVIHRRVVLPWEVTDWSDLAADEVERRTASLIEAERRHGFELTSAPLMRFNLIRLGDNQHHLIWTIHHILSDGWSTAIVLSDVLDRYGREPTDEERPSRRVASFRDHLAWFEAAWQD
jgi:NRPS condensation-like uncharacterized protein